MKTGEREREDNKSGEKVRDNERWEGRESDRVRSEKCAKEETVYVSVGLCRASRRRRM